MWINLVLQALSMAWKAVGSRASAFLISLAKTSFLSFLTTSEIASFLRRLKTALCFEALKAFLADEVIGIDFLLISYCQEKITQTRQKSNMTSPFPSLVKEGWLF